MELSTNNIRSYQPKPISELLPGLSGILSKNAMESLASAKKASTKKAPRPTMATMPTMRARPRNLAEMKSDILGLRTQSPKRISQMPSAKKRGWNSSVKVDYKISHTADGQMKNNPVRKVLDFQPPAKPKPPVSARSTIAAGVQNPETPTFQKPGFRPKKTIPAQARNILRISGIGALPPTPVEIKTPNKNRMTANRMTTVNRMTLGNRLTTANKENTSYQANRLGNPAIKLITATPKRNVRNEPLEIPQHMNNIGKPASKLIATPKRTTAPKRAKMLETPQMNSTWRTGSDESFLLNEKEIYELDVKCQADSMEPTLENIAEISPPVSTPFKEYRSVQEFFNHSNSIDDSALYNGTIMCFEKPTVSDKASPFTQKENKEESVIMSLCELFNKATVATSTDNKEDSELGKLLEEEKQMENNIKTLERVIDLLTNIKKGQMKSLQNVKLLIEENKKRKVSESDKDMTLVGDGDLDSTVVTKTPSPEGSPIISRPCSVIKKTPRSPVYKIPKKSCLRTKVICKSVANVSTERTPTKDINGKALNMYMQMKERLNFLSTPMVNREPRVPDTPAVTSHNLKKQLDKLFGS